jgi:beta-fructofuranosidase
MREISRRRFLWQAGCLTASAALPHLGARAAHGGLQSKLASDKLRPQFHLMPAANWMNDPNAPIFYRGRYHMFYQYNPNGAFWGSMHWAHATSPDIIHWQHEPLAIAPTPNGWDRDGVFSGSAVLDGTTPTVIYTGVLPPASPAEVTLDDGNHKWREVQCLAIAKDLGLQTWEKLGEPIILRPPEHMMITGFRDPCVWKEGKEWLLTLGSGIKGKGGAVLLYESRDLRRWTYRHPLIEGRGTGQPAVNPVDNGEMWECPDFFALGDRHVLLYAAMGKVWWKTGTYRNRRFTAEKEGVVDWGSYYAAKTMLDEHGNRILWGWIPETRPESEYRAAGWAGVMALPRVLSLGPDKRLRMTVAPAVEVLRTWHVSVKPGDGNRAKAITGIRISDLSGEIAARLSAKRGFHLRLRSEKGEKFAEISYDPGQGGMELRVNAISVPLPAEETVNLRAWLDGSVLEVLVNDVVAITARVYSVPSSPLTIDIGEIDGLESLDVWGMKAISKDRLTTSA